MAVCSTRNSFNLLRHIYLLHSGCWQQPWIFSVSATHHFALSANKKHPVTAISKCFVWPEFFRTFGLYASVHPMHGEILSSGVLVPRKGHDHVAGWWSAFWKIPPLKFIYIDTAYTTLYIFRKRKVKNRIRSLNQVTS